MRERDGRAAERRAAAADWPVPGEGRRGREGGGGGEHVSVIFQERGGNKREVDGGVEWEVVNCRNLAYVEITIR